MEVNPKTGSGPQTSWYQSPPISVQFSVKLFQKGNTLSPFNVDGFETRDRKLVCNVLKKLTSHIKFQLT